MVATRSKRRAHDDDDGTKHDDREIDTNGLITVGEENGGFSISVSGYEQFRQQRIKENKEKLQKLGIVDLSLKLKPHIVKKTGRINGSSGKKPQNQLLDSAHTGRSSRLETLKPVNYRDNPTKKKWESSGNGEDGKRIYDPVNGETCHQCRQKTLGHHTHCSKCDLGQGQSCGHCLYKRKKPE